MKKGADAFVRDKRGKKVLEGEKGGDERIKVFLKQCEPTQPDLLDLTNYSPKSRQYGPVKERWQTP
jgi:hypothetical protein